MRVFKHLLRHKAALAIVVCLLGVQAFTDLALPTMTSDIVDVGIQQAGVEYVATEEMSAETFEKACMLVSADDEALLREAYSQNADGDYSLAVDSEAEREKVDAALTLPFAAMSMASTTDRFSLNDLYAAYQVGAVSKQQVLDMLEEAKAQAGGISDAVLEQQAIQMARAEYEALGYDMNDMQMGYLLRSGGAMLALAALGMVAAACVSFVASRTGARIGYELRSRFFERVVEFSDADVGKFSVASLITRGTNDIQLIQMVSTMLMRMVLFAPILAFGGVIMILRTNASMGWIIVVAILAVFVVLAIVFKVALPKFKIMQKLIDRVNLVAREMLTGLPVVRAFGREAVEEDRFDDASTDLMKTQLFTNRVMSFMNPAMMLIMNGTSVAIVWFGAHYVDAGTIQTGDLIAFITYAMVIVMGFLMIGMIAIMLPRADVAAERIDEVLSTQPSIRDPQISALKGAEGARGACAAEKDAKKAAQGVVVPDGASAEVGVAPDEKRAEAECAERREKPFGARIEFNDVSFRYDDSSEYVLEHVTFTAEPGQTLAIVGSTGSGKSTIVKLIERFHDVSEGSVTIDGVDVRDMTQHELRSQLGYVPQKAFLFSGTIESNVAYGLIGEGAGKGEIDAKPAENAAVARALDIAQAADFVAEKEDGVRSEVSQGGTNVSGGQRQRLAIARALATNARAYLFDDSFSALDYKTDAALRQRLAQDLGEATQIIVAQRISTVLHADCIVVLDEGRVVGMGTHDELMQACDEYREIALSQLSEEELGGGDAR